MAVPLHRIVGAAAGEADLDQGPDVALAAAAIPGPAPATQDPDLVVVLTPGQDPALVLTARVLEADPGHAPRVLTEELNAANHVQSPKTKVGRENGFGGVLSAVWCFIQRYNAFYKVDILTPSTSILCF